MTQLSSSAWPPALTAALAQEIAQETSAIIGYGVLITDTQGIVIGSGDTSRVGSFHEASVEVVRNVRSAYHSADQARRLQGVRPGITLPITIDGQAVGTVGITGSPAQVRRFGLMVKRHTEILLQESLLVRSRLLQERALEDLVRDIAHFDPEVTDADELAYLARELGYDLRLPRVAVVVDLGETRRSRVAGLESGAETGAVRTAGPALGPARLRLVRERFSDPQDICGLTASGRFVALRRVTPGSGGDAPDAGLRALCQGLVEAIRLRFGLSVRIGIGGRASGVAELQRSCSDATAALRVGTAIASGESVYAIGEFRVQQILAAVAIRSRSRFVDTVSGVLRAQADWPVIRGTIIAWCENGFSLVKTAAALNIHRNTLVYRLAKITDLMKRPASDYRWWLAVYLACVADQLGD